MSWLIVALVALGALAVVFALYVWLDRELERRRPKDLPRPQPRSVAGESHRPWM